MNKCTSLSLSRARTEVYKWLVTIFYMRVSVDFLMTTTKLMKEMKQKLMSYRHDAVYQHTSQCSVVYCPDEGASQEQQKP